MKHKPIRQILMQLGDWTIYKDKDTDPSMFEFFPEKTWAYHTNCVDLTMLEYPGERKRCSTCQKTIPDEVQAILILHDWDTYNYGN